MEALANVEEKNMTVIAGGTGIQVREDSSIAGANVEAIKRSVLAGIGAGLNVGGSPTTSTIEQLKDKVLARRWGYGANATGGALGTAVKIDPSNLPLLWSSIEHTDPRFIFLDPALHGTEGIFPRSGLTNSSADRKMFFGPNKTYCGTDINGNPVDFKIQMTPENGYDGGVTYPVPGQRYLGLMDGNCIVIGMYLKGDLRDDADFDPDVGDINGKTDGIVVGAGEDYFLENCTLANHSDESSTIDDFSATATNNVQTTNPIKPNNITLSRMHYTGCKNGMIIGSAEYGWGLKVSQGDNRFSHIRQGRSPAIVYNADLFLVNCLIEEFTKTGGQAHVGGRVESRHCVAHVLMDQLKPKPVNHPVVNSHTLFRAHPSENGAWRDVGSWLHPNVGGWVTQESPRLGAGDPELFTLPATPEFNNFVEITSSEQDVADHVLAVAGHLNTAL